MRMLLQRVNLAWLWWWVAVYGGSLTVLSAYGLSLLARRALSQEKLRRPNANA